VDERIASCAPCRRQFEALRSVVRVLDADDARRAEMPIPTGALASRVRARLRETAANPGAAVPARRSASPALAFAAMGALALGVAFVSRQSGAPSQPGGSADTRTVAAEPVSVADDEAAFLERLEREQVRQSAVRYLADAQDVLVHVAGLPDDCADPGHGHVSAAVQQGLSHEAERSRALLLRRARLAPEQNASLAAARSVIADVEGVLRQVAELPRCTRREDLDAIRESLDRKRLLMKIDLVSQELAG
jgi:hypothetical protein